MKVVLIAGGSGLIGQDLKQHLKSIGFEVRILSRASTQPEKGIYHWNIQKQFIDPLALENLDTVINLAGSRIIGNRWTKKNKARHTTSRINSTRLLVQTINKQTLQINHFIQASAMGYFGDCGDQVLIEDSPPGQDFMATLCSQWEAEAKNISEINKLSILRIGLYLSPNGGVYTLLKRLSKFYLATSFGSGKQYVNYTHRDEFCGLVTNIIRGKISSNTYHAVGPKAMSLAELTRSIARANKRTVIFPNIPAFLLKLVLGEASSSLLNSHRIESSYLNEKNYHLFKTLDEAIQALEA